MALQLYNVHLVNGDVLQVGEDYDLRGPQTIVNRLDAFIKSLKTHPLLTTSVLPISDGMTISVKRSGNHGEEA